MVDTSNEIRTPWKNGNYRGHPGMFRMLCLVEGENFKMYSASGEPTNQDDPGITGTLVYGDFGEARPEVAIKTGKSQCNVEINLLGVKMPAVLSEDGKRITYFGPTNAVDFLEWITEEEVEEYKDSGDPVDTLPTYLKIQPENQGKLLYISGAPGLGKSTSGHLLSKKAGYVYYEADAFLNHLNPYISPEEDDPVAWMTQNFLKGVPQERIDGVAIGLPEFFAMGEGKTYDFEKLCTLYSTMCVDIAKEKKRIGGDWVVAQACPTRALRDNIRAKLGPNLIFVVLYMTKEDQIARTQARHGDDPAMVNFLTKMYDFYEPATEDEPNAIHLDITKDMTKDEVVEKILRMVKTY